MERDQSKKQSFIEAIINVVVGYGVATIACWLILPFFGAPISMASSMAFGGVMTIISIARSYVLRRAFNWWHVKQHQIKKKAVMDFEQYQKLAQRTEKPLDLNGALQHGMLGVITEAGEMGDTVKRVVIYGKSMDDPVPGEEGKTMRDNVKEEMGDLLWYLAVIANNLGFSMTDVAAENIAKLQKRYPEKYSDADALERKDKK